MSTNMNIVILAGNLTRAPELRYTPRGSPVASFSIAVNRKWKDAQGKLNDEPCFVDCECWGTIAENVTQYLGKGSSVLIRGRLKLDRWTDKQTGKARSKLKCVAEIVQFVNSPRRRQEQSEAGNGGRDELEEQAIRAGASGLVDELPPDDDVPF